MIVLKTRRTALVIILCAAVGVAAGASLGKSSSASNVAAGVQDVINLDRRISALEQRLYSIELNINRLGQQSGPSPRTPTTPASGGELEVRLLRGEIETLQRRLGEIECGLVKLDERTAARAASGTRQRREGAGGGGGSSTDPCRLNAEAPLRFSTRP